MADKRTRYAAKSVENRLTRQYRGLGSALLSRVQTGIGMTDPDRGISLNLLTKSGKLDQRKFKRTTKRVGGEEQLRIDNSIMDDYERFTEEVKLLEASFSRSLYTKIRRAYRGTGSVKPAPLSPSTIKRRRSSRVYRITPYYESGDFLNNGIRHIKETNTVYINPGTHPKRAGQKDGQPPIKYIQIYYMNEFGYPDLSIPARPVWRPILRELLQEKEKELSQLIERFIK